MITRFLSCSVYKVNFLKLFSLSDISTTSPTFIHSTTMRIPVFPFSTLRSNWLSTLDLDASFRPPSTLVLYPTLMLPRQPPWCTPYSSTRREGRVGGQRWSRRVTKLELPSVTRSRRPLILNISNREMSRLAPFLHTYLDCRLSVYWSCLSFEVLVYK